MIDPNLPADADLFTSPVDAVHTLVLRNDGFWWDFATGERPWAFRKAQMCELDMLAEVHRLRKENGGMAAELSSLREQNRELRAENLELRAENTALMAQGQYFLGGKFGLLEP